MAVRDPNTAPDAVNHVATDVVSKRPSLPERLGMGRTTVAPVFQIGPDAGVDRPDGPIQPFAAGSLRGTRPYFVVPADEGSEELQKVRARIKEWVTFAADRPVTILFRGIDVQRPGALVRRLRDDADADIAYLRTLLSVAARAVVDTLPVQSLSELDRINDFNRADAIADPVRLAETIEQNVRVGRIFETLVNAMNDLLLGAILVVPDRFPKAPISARLRDAAANPDLAGMERAAVNRHILAGVLNSGHRSGPLIAEEPAKRGTVSDIYVLSHGWHRKFFSAVAAYDRLFSRFAVLLSRRRLRNPYPFNPLFLMIHWNSDPGGDSWVDPDGKRKLSSFMTNVEAVFQRPTEGEDKARSVGSRFTDVFELIFGYLTQLSDPETQALEHASDQTQGQTLAARLADFPIRDAPYAFTSEKVSAVWRCYFEAEAQRPLANQNQTPTPWRSLTNIIAATVKFALGIWGIGLILAILKASFWKEVIGKSIVTAASQPGTLIYRLLHSPPARLVIHAPGWLQPELGLLVCLVSGLALMTGCLLWKRISAGGRRSNAVPIVPVLAWALMQAPLLVVQILALAIVAVIAAPFSWMPGVHRFGLYDERVGKRNADLSPAVVADHKASNSELIRQLISDWRLIVSRLVRLPVEMLRGSLAADAKLPGFVSALDNQLAFWEMQAGGVAAGGVTASFLNDLHGDLSSRGLLHGDLRIHLIGHSFGCLVAANAARALALTVAYADRVKSVFTVCLVQGALACSWFEEEVRLAHFIKGSLVCIFSAYDTANSFYYPLANAARSAAGALGLTWVGDRQQPDRLPRLDDPAEAALFATVLQTPDLAHEVNEGGGRSSPPHILNLDASRVIFEGPIASGGGHGDVFKDDVVHLIWAATRLGEVGRHRPSALEADKSDKVAA